MNDRFIATRSPISSKYRRVIEGLELDPAESPGLEGNVKTVNANSNEVRQGVYRRLFGAEVVESSSPSSKTNDSTVSRSFLSVNNCEKQSKDDDLHFIAPILYGKKGSRTTRRPLQSTPIKILDAPGLEDDFYLNLLDWEAKNNRVSVLLGGNEVYFWNANNLTSDPSSTATTTTTSSLGRLGSNANFDKGCVIKWSTLNQSHLAIGTKNGIVEIWDAERSVRLHNWLGHSGNRCGVLSWTPTTAGTNFDGQLSSGGRDNRIIHYDLRTARGIVSTTGKGHTQEVCGLKYDHYGSGLLASGGNDNQLLVWDRRRDQTGPLLELNQHTAAVKAIDWSPHQSGLLASGGGTADRTIRFWNTKLPSSANIISGSSSSGNNSPNNNCNYASIKPIQASSQVCTLAWSPLAPGEILSTHGFSEHNLALWSYPSGKCLGTLDGHSQRVLFQAMGPDGSTVVTGSGDETLRFWSVFRRPAASEQQSQNRTRATINNLINLEDVLQASR